jgi:hypothetical protein
LDLNRLPVKSQSNLPVQWEGAGAAALVLSATALVARAGLKLLARGIMSQVTKGLARKRASSLVERKPQVAPRQAEEQPDYVVWGWRSWSIRRGQDQSSGSEQFEWRIKRKASGRQ